MMEPLRHSAPQRTPDLAETRSGTRYFFPRSTAGRVSSPGRARGWQGTWVPPSLPLSRTVCTPAPSNPGSAHASRGSAAPKSQPPARSTCLWQSALLRCAPRFCDARGAPPGPVGLQDAPEGRALSAEARVPPPAAACPESAGPQPRRPRGR